MMCARCAPHRTPAPASHRHRNWRTPRPNGHGRGSRTLRSAAPAVRANGRGRFAGAARRRLDPIRPAWPHRTAAQWRRQRRSGRRRIRRCRSRVPRRRACWPLLCRSTCPSLASPTSSESARWTRRPSPHRRPGPCRSSAAPIARPGCRPAGTSSRRRSHQPGSAAAPVARRPGQWRAKCRSARCS